MVARAKDLARKGYAKYLQRSKRHAPDPRLAFYSPMPPEPTGVASYSVAVLDGLRRIGFSDGHPMDVVWPIEAEHEGMHKWYRLGIYQLGNNVKFHRDIYRFACSAPGLVVLHDLALDDFVRGMKVEGDPLGFVAEREAATLRRRLSSEDALRNEPLRVPWCGHVVRRARGVVVHSEFCKRYLLEIGCRTPIFVVPHPVIGSEAEMSRAKVRGAALRKGPEGKGARSLVVAPGDMNEAKQLGALLAAAHSLPNDVHVALVGRRIEGSDADAAVAASGLGERVTLAPDVSDEDFLGWLHAADVIVDLRFPHRGEVSGALARAMQVGRPSIVSATGTYLDISEDFVVRIAPGPADPAELAARIRTLLEDDDLRSRMGGAALEYMKRLGDSEATARGYAAAIEATLELVRDPARKAYARWSGALADMGVDEEALANGFGLSYARAMESFKQRS